MNYIFYLCWLLLFTFYKNKGILQHAKKTVSVKQLLQHFLFSYFQCEVSVCLFPFFGLQEAMLFLSVLSNLWPFQTSAKIMLWSEIGCPRKFSDQFEYTYIMFPSDTAKELFHSQSLRHLTGAAVKFHWGFSTVNAGQLSNKNNLSWERSLGIYISHPQLKADLVQVSSGSL